jgi:uncharacterized protein YndB with AHSA1/START domain
MVKPQRPDGVSCTVTIDAPAEAVLAAFFDHEALAQWWHVRRSLCLPRPLGCYALEWEASERRDEVLGRLGGVFHGMVMTWEPQREFFVAEAYWMPPDTDPIGPMAFEVTCSPAGSGTTVHVRQSGAEPGERSDHYYEALDQGLRVSLERLKARLETRPARQSAP